jgi:hypothetical protein
MLEERNGKNDSGFQAVGSAVAGGDQKGLAMAREIIHPSLSQNGLRFPLSGIHGNRIDDE